MLLKRLRSDDAGANAIEYAVIGALIGIGLIGSLVGTRTSLSAIFGTAATQMASGGSGGGSSTQGLWASKTIASKTSIPWASGNATQYQYSFTDGSRALYTVSNSATNYKYNPTVELFSPGNGSDWTVYRMSTTQYPNGVYGSGVITDASTGAHTSPVYIGIDPNGNLTDLNQSPAPAYNGTLAGQKGYADTLAAYQYLGTLP